MPAPVSAPRAGTFACVFCRRVLRESDVFYFSGEIACEPCYHFKSAENQVPMGTCGRCGAQVALERMLRLEDRVFCDECANDARIESNQRLQARRVALDAARPHYASSRSYTPTTWVSSLIGGLVGLGILLIAFIVVVRAWNNTSRVPDRIPVEDGTGGVQYITREDAIHRLETDPSFSLKLRGKQLSRDEALRKLRR